MYGVLYHTVQPCRAAISFLVFLPQPRSVKMTANTISEYLAQFLLGLPKLELLKKLFICIFHLLFENLKVSKFYKGKEERIIQFDLSCHKTALIYLFLYACE